MLDGGTWMDMRDWKRDKATQPFQPLRAHVLTEVNKYWQALAGGSAGTAEFACQ